MRKFQTVAIALLFCLAGGAALAQDGVVVVEDWSGLFVGGGIGGAVTESEFDFMRREWGEGFSSTSTGRSSDDGTGGTVDAFIGMNAVYGRVLLGGQLEASLGNLDFNTTINLTSISNDGRRDRFPQAVGIRSDWSVGAIGRIGILVCPNTLLYALGGFTYARFEVEDVWPIRNITFEEDAIVVGFGGEHKFGPNLSLRGEYRFADFDDRDITAGANYTGGGASGTLNLNTDVHYLRAAVVIGLQ